MLFIPYCLMVTARTFNTLGQYSTKNGENAHFTVPDLGMFINTTISIAVGKVLFTVDWKGFLSKQIHGNKEQGKGCSCRGSNAWRSQCMTYLCSPPVILEGRGNGISGDWWMVILAKSEIFHISMRKPVSKRKVNSFGGRIPKADSTQIYIYKKMHMWGEAMWTGTLICGNNFNFFTYKFWGIEHKMFSILFLDIWIFYPGHLSL